MTELELLEWRFNKQNKLLGIKDAIFRYKIKQCNKCHNDFYTETDEKGIAYNCKCNNCKSKNTKVNAYEPTINKFRNKNISE